MILIHDQHYVAWVFMQLWFQNLLEVEIEAGYSLLASFLRKFIRAMQCQGLQHESEGWLQA